MPTPMLGLNNNKPDRATSRAQNAYDSLRAAIHAGKLRPGQPMRETEIAERLGISRTPVRDALKRLESEGLLAAAPRRGLVLTELDQQQVSEIYAVRDVLEGLAARLAAQHASSAEIAAMRDLLERQTRTQPGDAAALARLNRVFHDVVYRAARNRYLVSVLDSFEGTLALLPGTTYMARGRPATALKEHHEIVDAIEQHRSERAEAVASAHVRAAEHLRLLMISREAGADGGSSRRPAARRRVGPSRVARRKG